MGKIIAGMLFIGVLPLPYDYYILLRLVVSIGSLIHCFFYYRKDEMNLVYVFGFLAILFNPIVPVYLNKLIWVIIDILSGILFLIYDPSLNYFNRFKKDLLELARKSPTNFTITIINIFLGGSYLITIIAHIIIEESTSILEVVFGIPILGVLFCLPVMLPMGLFSAVDDYIISKIIKNEVYNDIMFSIWLLISLLIGWYWIGLSFLQARWY